MRNEPQTDQAVYSRRHRASLSTKVDRLLAEVADLRETIEIVLRDRQAAAERVTERNPNDH